jgi:hypothetical protein
MKWRQASGILSDKRVPQKLKGMFYMTSIWPAMLYGAECWQTKRWYVRQLGVASMRMLRWMCGHTRRDRIQNDDIRGRVGVKPIAKKLIQHRLRWVGHIQCRPLYASVHSGRLKRAYNVKRGWGRPNLTWEESVKRDLKDWSITKELAMDRAAWKLAIHVPEPWVGCEISWVSPLAYPNLFGTNEFLVGFVGQSSNWEQTHSVLHIEARYADGLSDCINRHSGERLSRSLAPPTLDDHYRNGNRCQWRQPSA